MTMNMTWEDVGGYSKVQHIVTGSSYGIYTRTICEARFTYGFFVKRRRPLPKCRKCVILFQKLSDKLLKEAYA